MEIITNKIKCNSCGDIIESCHRHDFKTCRCGRVSVDGGHSYLRRRFKESSKDYTELSVINYTEDEIKEIESERRYVECAYHQTKGQKDEKC